MSVCLLVHPHSSPSITWSALANSYQMQQEVEVSKTVKFLKFFVVAKQAGEARGMS